MCVHDTVCAGITHGHVRQTTQRASQLLSERQDENSGFLICAAALTCNILQVNISSRKGLSTETRGSGLKEEVPPAKAARNGPGWQGCIAKAKCSCVSPL